MTKQYYPTIGLEIHAELNTASKMFCACKNDPDETRPNANICPICMGHPGTLPTANKKAIESVIKVGLAVDGTIADFTEFDRKNYFYPDIPKGYQISQYKFPIVSGGTLNNIALTRIHIEEDTGLSKHDRGDFTLVDFNRAGVPLMELVTEPVIHSAKEAGDFARELQLLLRYLGVSEANMEKGEMRVEANISLSDDPKQFGTKVEVKNLNSFRSVERAIAFELNRMEQLYEAGKQDEIVQETRGWDENKQVTFSQRSKESAHDYRYFPDPDLPKMKLHSVFDIERMKKELPQLPWQVRERLKERIKNSELIEIFVQDSARRTLLMSMPVASSELAANYIVSILDSANLGATTPANFGRVIDMIAAGMLSSTAGKELIGILIKEGGDPDVTAKNRGMLQLSDAASLTPTINEVISENEKIVADYKGGKEAALQSLIGQVMKKTKGAANPEVTLKILKEML
ncbi:MAG TPA: Asp-tRNA(Asn)/Glu-tRNA(Gln) amidotransferase subunit GatB [Candidatus Paceibacterota bacterium]|nr:Asp-tRNA(Asn)/Glu-tRNA(Gln) amidotransferase subunit GatB [Candidatus Paceibacterota bacterium]